ncbi:MAG: hypothetical protein FWF59_05375 [Turicibacter sp.]|nr:hypothetical protein [Turicibacter sp.]
MEFYMLLPRNKREFALFLVMVSILSVNILAPVITFFEVGFGFAVWADVLGVMPALWCAVIGLVLLTHKPADWLAQKVIPKGSGFKKVVAAQTACSVFFLSICLTVVGSWIGNRHFSMEPFSQFFYKWPRNFALALMVELLAVQPFARFMMLKYHQWVEKKSPTDMETP